MKGLIREVFDFFRARPAPGVPASKIRVAEPPLKPRLYLWVRIILWCDRFINPEIAEKIDRYGIWIGMGAWFPCLLLLYWFGVPSKTIVFWMVSVMVFGGVGLMSNFRVSSSIWSSPKGKPSSSGCDCSKLFPYSSSGWIKNRISAHFYCTIGRGLFGFVFGWGIATFCAVLISELI